MNYYEELGIRQDASVEEIRQAYKQLARILHPDGQPDPALRAMSEIQMKRLNEIVAILVNPWQRIEYDYTLAGHARPAGAPAWVAPARRRSGFPPGSAKPWSAAVSKYWFWALLGGVAFGTGLWYVATRDTDANVAASAAPAQADPEAAWPQAPMQADPQTYRQETKETGSVSPEFSFSPPRRTPANPGPVPDPFNRPPREDRFVAVGPRQIVPAPGPAPPSVAPPEPPRSAHEAPEPRSRTQSANPLEPSLAGNWLYSPETVETLGSGLYPAWYAELALLEDRGTLVGNYRALYRVPDKALSPQMVFRMQGKSPTGKSAAMEWVSEDGAKGQAEITLRSPNVLTVTWWTTQQGRHATVNAGSAQLIRQQAP